MRSLITLRRIGWSWVSASLLISGIALGQTNTLHPLLVCDEPTFDFGVKPNSIDVEHNFVIRNAGTGPLIISQVRSGCGCTQAQLGRYTIDPGSNTVLSTRLNLKGVIGPKRTSIYLHSNDPEKPVFQCQLTGSAMIDLSVNPSQLTFAYSSLGSPAEQRLIVTGQASSTARITSVECQGSFFRATLETNAPGYGVIRVTPATNSPAECLQGMLIISTDHPKFPKFIVPVQSSIVRDITAYPSEITFDPSEPQTRNHDRYVVLRRIDDQPFNVTNVVVIPPAFPARLHSMKPVWAKLKVGPIIPEKVNTGAIIRVYTDLPGAAPLDIPVRPIKRP